MYFNNEEIEYIFSYNSKNKERNKTFKEILENFEDKFERHNLSDSEKNHILNKIFFTNGKITNNPPDLKCPICNGKYVAKTHYYLQDIAYYIRRRILTEKEKEELRIKEANRMLEKTDVAEKEEDFRDYFCLHCGARWNGEKEDIIEFKVIEYQDIKQEELANKNIGASQKEIIKKVREAENKERDKECQKLKNEYLLDKKKIEIFSYSGIRINMFENNVETLFEDMIRVRGKKFYEENMIHNCVKTQNQYISYVQASDFNNEYQVKIIVNKSNEIIRMECSCPYPNNCKHEYATILYIKNKCEQ